MMAAKKTKWPLGLAFVIAAFMLTILTAVIFSLTQKVELVETDYYQQEIIYEQQIARLERTRELAVKPIFAFDRTTKTLVLTFPAEYGSPNLQGEIKFFRPSDSALDRAVPLRLDAKHQQTFTGSQFDRGFWKIKMHWIADSLEYYHEQSMTFP